MAKRKQAEAEKTLASFRESIPLLCTELTEAEAAAAVKLQWTQRPSTRTPLRQSGRRRRALLDPFTRRGAAASAAAPHDTPDRRVLEDTWSRATRVLAWGDS